MATVESLLFALRRRGIATARELAADLGVSQPTLSRLVTRARSSRELVVLGKARAARYAAVDPTTSFRAGVTVHRVDARGRITRFGELVPLVVGSAFSGAEDRTGTVQERQSKPGAEDRTGTVRERQSKPADREPQVARGLPWFVEELRPQGFLGRLFARSLPRELAVPPDPRLWTADQLLRALVHRAEDLPGDLLIGDAARERHLERLLSPNEIERAAYEAVVARQLEGDAPGSSAGGEQPKFACTAPGQRALIVKYSPPLDASPSARRWADLLLCEHLALETLRTGGVAAARSAYVEIAGRAYLEVERFDRTTEGRIGVVSGTTVDAEFVGGGAWVALAEGLVTQQRLSRSDLEGVRLLHLFGGLIGNTDMHLGNVAFFTDDYATFRLAPAYDMLPMALRPTAHGELPVVEPAMPMPTHDTWARAADLAESFHARVREEARVGVTVRAFAERCLVKLTALRRVALRTGSSDGRGSPEA